MEQKQVEQLRSRECPICGTVSHRLLYKVPAKQFYIDLYGVSYASVVKCGTCGLVHTNPVLNESLDSDQYTNPAIGYHKDTVSAAHELYSVDQVLCMEEVKAHCRSSGTRVLDVGCGRGGFVFLCQEEGYDCKGIDIDPAGLTVGSRLGVRNLHCSDILDESDSQYDCIACIHVLEHCRDIRTMAKQFFRVLKCSGICVVAVPNYRSWRFSIHPQRYWSEAYMHINGLTNRHLDRVFKQYGFTRLGMCTPVAKLCRMDTSIRGHMSLCFTKVLGNSVRCFPAKLICIYKKP